MKKEIEIGYKISTKNWEELVKKYKQLLSLDSYISNVMLDLIYNVVKKNLNLGIDIKDIKINSNNSNTIVNNYIRYLITSTTTIDKIKDELNKALDGQCNGMLMEIGYDNFYVKEIK